MKCDNCKATISKRIIRADGLPNGLIFQRDHGKDITICADCIMMLGMLDEEGKEEFFRRLGVKT